MTFHSLLARQMFWPPEEVSSVALFWSSPPLDGQNLTLPVCPVLTYTAKYRIMRGRGGGGEKSNSKQIIIPVTYCLR